MKAFLTQFNNAVWKTHRLNTGTTKCLGTNTFKMR